MIRRREEGAGQRSHRQPAAPPTAAVPAGGDKITRDHVLAAELEIIDHDGAEALSMRRLVAGRLDLDDQQLTCQCEQAIRNYDPCISCVTHFLDLTVDHT